MPVPEVYAWNSKAIESPVGEEFIIREVARGVPKSQKWANLHEDDKLKVVEKIVEVETTLASTSFREFGSLYYAKDVVQSARKDLIYTNSTGRVRIDARFSIGPTTDHKSLDNDRAKFNFNRGPC